MNASFVILPVRFLATFPNSVLHRNAQSSLVRKNAEAIDWSAVLLEQGLADWHRLRKHFRKVPLDRVLQDR